MGFSAKELLEFRNLAGLSVGAESPPAEESLEALTLELRTLAQEGIWSGIKKVAGKVASAADTAVSAVPVVGTAYNAGRAAISANKAIGKGIVGAAQWATGHKKAAADTFKQAKSAGADAATRGAVAGAAAIPVPGAGLAAKAGAVGLKSGIKKVATAGGAAAQSAIARPKKKPTLGTTTASESVAAMTGCELTEFKRLSGH